MKTKSSIAKELGISRKTLYNYLDILNIKDLNESNLSILKEYSYKKTNSRDISKSSLYTQLEELKILNSQLEEQNKSLKDGQEILLQQVEYYRNSIDTEIRQIKENIVYLLNPPKKSKKSLISYIKDYFNQ